MSMSEELKIDRSVITGVTEDSRKVQRGFVFIAFPGQRTDGRRYISDAISNGAAVIVTDHEADVAQAGDVQIIRSDNPRYVLSQLAKEFYGAQPENIVAVTGTNGKTSTVSFVEQIWNGLGFKAASLGTLGLKGDGLKSSGVSMTTPNAVSLMQDLADLKAAGFTHLAMEASSHGLDQYRLHGAQINAAGFTNLSRDHLDYHGDMDSYLEAKAKLFSEVLPKDGTAVLNADSQAFDRLTSIIIGEGRNVMSFGDAQSDMQILDIEATPSGQDVKLLIDGEDVQTSVSFIGYYQLKNLLCAIGLVMISAGSGLDDKKLLKQIFEIVPTLTAPAGRLQFVAGHPKSAGVYIDYAHTPAALETVLNAVRPHTKNKLAVVFGCGGDRDRGKRPMMGETASSLADIVIVTDDNPRSENPADIRASIMASASGATEIGDRREAIQTAIQNLQEGDVLVIAGKGHEQGQILQDKTISFDDYSVAKEVIEQL